MTKSKQDVSLANGWKLRAGTGEGTAYCSCINECLPMLYVPRLIFNLLSVRAMVKAGFVVTFQGDKCLIEKQGKSVTARLDNGLIQNAFIQCSTCPKGGGCRPSPVPDGKKSLLILQDLSWCLNAW
uniref:Uncharacterized protein n=1 Tax=Micrurus corallinus TaxID=54390 RepID=A0A2D4ERI2_MICCO